MSKKTTAIILPIIVIALVAVISMKKDGEGAMSYKTASGLVFGTSYNITYESDKALEAEIKAVFDSVDYSLSPFNKESIITAVNENRPVEVNDYFIEVFTLAKKVHKATDGAFDITVAPLVNVWGFGFKEGHFPTDSEVDSLRQII
ncbi:MAG: FAD:protein FMN transferase, partial [Prevotella sp.]|nr:FAD:protein FMN transferase [Prevotella sp.]